MPYGRSGATAIGFNRNKVLRKKLSTNMQEKLQSCVDRLELGRSYRQKMREDHWRTAYEQYMGLGRWAYTPDDPTADLVNINVSFSTISTIVPFVADENPKFLLSPESGDASPEYAQVLETFTNRLWQSKDVEGQVYVSEATFDYLLYGDGWLKVCYEIKDQPTYSADGQDVSNERIQVANFYVERPSPWDIWIDPYSDGLHNARWIAQRIVLPAKVLQEDKRYVLTKDIEEGQVDDNYMSQEDRDRLDDTRGYVTIYEFYDLEEEWMLSFVAGGQRAIRYIEHVKCPIVQLHNYRIPNSPYHMGDLEMISWLQDELNKTRSQMITHRRRNVSKWLYREGAVDEDGLEALKSGRINDAVPVKSAEPFDYLVTQVVASPLQADVYQMDAAIRQDINEITGVNEYLRGMPQGISRTATEASILEGATNIRTRHKLLQIERASQQAGQLLVDIIQEVLPLTAYEEMSMYVTGREADKLSRAQGMAPGQDAVVTPTPELFVGSYRVEVERGSTELRNPQIKSQKMRDMVSMMLSATPILMQLGIPFNMQAMLELWFEAEGIEDVDALFEMGEDQGAMAQVLMMQQMQGLMGQGGGASGVPTDGQVAGGKTPPGAPSPQTAVPPSDMVDSGNSGMLPPSSY